MNTLLSRDDLERTLIGRTTTLKRAQETLVEAKRLLAISEEKLKRLLGNRLLVGLIPNSQGLETRLTDEINEADFQLQILKGTVNTAQGVITALGINTAIATEWGGMVEHGIHVIHHTNAETQLVKAPPSSTPVVIVPVIPKVDFFRYADGDNTVPDAVNYDTRRIELTWYQFPRFSIEHPLPFDIRLLLGFDRESNRLYFREEHA